MLSNKKCDLWEDFCVVGIVIITFNSADKPSIVTADTTFMWLLKTYLVKLCYSFFILYNEPNN